MYLAADYICNKVTVKEFENGSSLSFSSQHLQFCHQPFITVIIVIIHHVILLQLRLLRLLVLFV